MRTRKGIFLYTDKYEKVTLTRRSGTSPIESWCDECGACVKWLTVTEVAALTGISVQAATAKMGEGAFHFKIEADGRVLICSRTVAEVG